MKRYLTVALFVLFLALGALAGTAGGDNGNGNGPPATNPGSPGDDCSRGNSDQDCRPDPQPDKGKDCEDHGNARGNEDHCDEGTTPEEPPVDTTTPEEPPVVTTTPETPEVTTSTPSVATDTTVPATAPTSAPTSTPAATKPKAPVKAKPKAAKKAQPKPDAPKVKAKATKATPAETLPYTGVPVWLLLALGSGLIGTGAMLIRAGR